MCLLSSEADVTSESDVTCMTSSVFVLQTFHATDRQTDIRTLSCIEAAALLKNSQGRHICIIAAA